MNTIEEIDKAIELVNNRASFWFDHELTDILGDGWFTENPNCSFSGIVSINRTTDALLERRFQLEEGSDYGSIQEELDSLTGSDISVS
jgi:hypothetical protein